MISLDLAYKEVLEERIKDINLEIEKLRKRDDSLFALHTQIANRIKGLQIEREKLTEEIKHNAVRDILSEGKESAVSKNDEMYKKNEKQQEDLKKRIDELKDAKSHVEGKHANKVLDRKIRRLENKINLLKDKNVILVKRQRKIIFPKSRKILKKQREISLQEGKIKNYVAMVNDNNVLKGTLSESGFDSIKGYIYDRKINRYNRKIEKANEIINKIQNRESSAHVSGARRVYVKKTLADRLRKMADWLSPTIAAPVRS